MSEQPFNPYIELGVTKKSTPVEIKKAYYDLSKTHHPDHGGDIDSFQRISKAYEILSDPEKRKYYDDTGFIKGQDNTKQMMNQLIFSVMSEAIMLFDPERDNILVKVREGMNNLSREALKKLSKMRTYLKRLRKVETKLKTKKDPILLLMLNQEIIRNQIVIERGEKEVKAIEEALSLLEDYTYEEDIHKQLERFIPFGGFGPMGAGTGIRYNE